VCSSDLKERTCDLSYFFEEFGKYYVRLFNKNIFSC
jgi:hypothetical protein